MSRRIATAMTGLTLLTLLAAIPAQAGGGWRVIAHDGPGTVAQVGKQVRRPHALAIRIRSTAKSVHVHWSVGCGTRAHPGLREGDFQYRPTATPVFRVLRLPWRVPASCVVVAVANVVDPLPPGSITIQLLKK